MQVVVDVNGMQINFGEHDLSGLGDFAHFCLPSKLAKFPFQTMGVKKFNLLESAQKIHASRG